MHYATAVMARIVLPARSLPRRKDWRQEDGCWWQRNHIQEAKRCPADQTTAYDFSCNRFDSMHKGNNQEEHGWYFHGDSISTVAIELSGSNSRQDGTEKRSSPEIGDDSVNWRRVDGCGCSSSPQGLLDPVGSRVQAVGWLIGKHPSPHEASCCCCWLRSSKIQLTLHNCSIHTNRYTTMADSAAPELFDVELTARRLYENNNIVVLFVLVILLFVHSGLLFGQSRRILRFLCKSRAIYCTHFSHLDESQQFFFSICCLFTKQTN